MPWLHMRDFLTFQTKEVEKNKKHLFECRDNTTESGKSLLVRVAATHSAIINGNMRFYRPDRMQQSAHTWLPGKDQYPKPVLMGHDENGQTLGRVLDAKYVDLSHNYSTDFPIIRDALFYSTDAKKIDLFKSVDWIVDNLMPLKEYSGLGYINLGMKISNPDAIQKVLRDEYLTVSVGFKTDSAICSVCHQDWAVDDRCEHELGDEVDGKSMFLINGNFDYEEVSFVNFPADPFAGTISKEKLADHVGKNYRFLLGLPRNAHPEIKLTDSLLSADIQPVEDTMPQAVIDVTKLDLNAFEESLKSPELTAEKSQTMAAELKQWQPETDELKTKKRSLVSTLNAKIKKNGWEKKIAPGTDAKTAAEIASLDTSTVTEAEKTEALGSKEDCGCGSKDDCACAPKLEDLEEADRSYFDDSDGIYAEMEVEIDAAVADGELKAEDTKDAKLSAAKRKGLSGSTFCGPNRSFPVPDCAHVTAARRLIGRAKVGASTKTKILSCVSRKAKSLGCSGKKDTVVITAEVTDKVKGIFTKLSLDLKDATAGEIAKMVSTLDKAYDSSEDNIKGTIRMAVSSMMDDWYADSSSEYWLKALAGSGKDKIFALIKKEELADKENALNTLTDEKVELTKQVSTADAKTASIFKDSKQALASQIVMYRVLKGVDGFKGLTAEQISEKIADLSKRHISSLKDSVADILTGLKWVAPTEGAGHEGTTSESGQVVNDSVKVAEPTAAGTEVKDAQALEAEEKARLAAFGLKLSTMTRTERDVFLLKNAYEAVSK